MGETRTPTRGANARQPRSSRSGGVSAGEALTVVVPMPPNVTNRRRGSTHWRHAWREKTEYHTTLDAIAAFCSKVTGEGWCGFHIPPEPPAPLARVTLTAHYVLRGAMDDDNAAARAKHLLDWLVRRGYLASDRRTCVRWAAFPEQTVTRKETPRITLTITPVAD
jgi:hypothetical protein